MDHTELCAALFDALAAGDESRVRALCAPDLQARQNANPPMSLDALLRFTRAVLNVVEDFRYENPIRAATPTGFVEEHRVRGTLPNGRALDLAACVVGNVGNGLITELREYVDSAAAADLIAALR